MKQRFFYLADIDTVETVETITKKDLISTAEGFKSSTWCDHDEVISGYTKDGKFFYYNSTNFWTFKKSDIVNAISVVYSSESGYYVYGDYTVNMYGVVNPTEDGETLIWPGGNIKEVESADYTENQTTEDQAAEDQTAEDQTTEVQAAEDQAAEDQAAEDQTTEESKNYYAESYNFGFIAHNSEYGAPSLLIFNSKEDREKYINKYDIYRGNVNKRVIAITAKEARKYYERTRDGVRGYEGICVIVMMDFYFTAFR